jgi:RNA polymerase sigma-70 factor (ECF subfamily)
VRTDRAFEDLYKERAEAVFTAVYAYCRNRDVAEDATQEAFARGLARWDRLRSQPWVAGWVTTTAINVARRRLRRRSVRPPSPPHTEDPDELLDLWSAIRSLPKRQQEALLLYYRMDLPVAEVAQVMRCREGTVRTHLARARSALRGLLGGEDDVGRRQDSLTS